MDQPTLNEMQLRFRGRVSVPFKLQTDESIKITVTAPGGVTTMEGQVIEQSTRSNHDGTFGLVSVIAISL